MQRFERANLLVLLIAIGVLSLAGAFLWLRLMSPSDGARLQPGTMAWKPTGVVVTPLREHPDGLQEGDLVVAVDGRSMEWWARTLFQPSIPRPAWHVGRTVAYTVIRDGERHNVAVRLERYPLGAVVARHWGAMVFALSNLLIGVFVFFTRPAERATNLLFLSAASMASATTWTFGLQIGDLVDGIGFWLFQATSGGAYLLIWITVLHFALVFPQPHQLIVRYRWLIPLLYIVPYASHAVYVAAARAGATSTLDWLGRADKDVGVIQLIYLSLTIGAAFTNYRATHNVVSRKQVRWVLLAFIAVSLFAIAFTLLPEIIRGVPLVSWNTVALAGLLVPLSLAVAILHDRLFDIDIILNRTLVYGALTASVVGVYALVVGALGALFNASGNLLIALLATGLVAVLFQPLRDRLQRAVNRLIYGERDDPYTVLARLGQRLETTLTPDAVLPTIVETVAQALKLPYAAIALRNDERGYPQGATHDEHPVSVVSGRLQQPTGNSRSTTDEPCEIVAAYGLPGGELLRLPLVYQHETVGTLLLAPRTPSERFTPADLRVLADLARQIAVAVHTVRLTTDLRRSRERLVMAREEERRRLRRDLHDDLGPTLASLAQRLDTAAILIPRDPDAAVALVRALKTQARTTITVIRQLVYALRPPTLDELGLVSAIREYAAQSSSNGSRAAPLRVFVDAPENIPPLPAAVEVAAYRIVLEALTNVLRHAHAQTCLVRLSIADALVLEIVDDGIGLLPDSRAGVGHTSMHERAAELGGDCRIEPTLPHGTRVWVRLPIPRE